MKYFLGFLVSIFIVFFLTSFVHTYIDRPVIGVMTTPTTCCHEPICTSATNESEYSYIDSAYVDFLRLSGARIVPVLFDWTEDQVVEALKYLNGLLIPGGGCDVHNYKTQYMESINIFYQKSKLEGEYFPIWGTDEGFIALLDIISDEELKIEYDMKTHETFGLTIEKENSRILEFASDEIINDLQNNNISYKSSSYGVTPKHFSVVETLNDYFDIVSTSRDGKGEIFVSMFEAKVEPVFGVSFNPEKILFQYQFSSHDKFARDKTEEVVVFSRQSMIANSYFSSFFVEMCRRSNHSFSKDVKLDSVVIENFRTVFTQKPRSSESKEEEEKSNYMTRVYFLPKYLQTPPEDVKRIDYLVTVVVISVAVCCCVCCCITVCCIVDKFYLWFIRKDDMMGIDKIQFKKISQLRNSREKERDREEKDDVRTLYDTLD